MQYRGPHAAKTLAMTSGHVIQRSSAPEVTSINQSHGIVQGSGRPADEDGIESSRSQRAGQARGVSRASPSRRNSMERRRSASRHRTKHRKRDETPESLQRNVKNVTGITKLESGLQKNCKTTAETNIYYKSIDDDHVTKEKKKNNSKTAIASS